MAGVEGSSTPNATADDTAATAHDLGNLTTAGIVRVPGAIGDDPFYTLDQGSSPGNDVDMYHFHVSGPGSYAFIAEVFAGRIGSPLDPGVSLFRLDPADHSLHFIDGNNNTYNPVRPAIGFLTPFYPDSVLYGRLTAGDYYVAVAGGSNVPSSLENQPEGSYGLFDPNVTHSGQNGWVTGPYVLNLLVRAVPDPPHVLSTSPIDGVTLPQAPTQISVQFDVPVNIPLLAFQTLQKTTQTVIASVYIQGGDGTKYFTRFESYDIETNRASFTMLDRLANGAYTLHLSGPDGLDDLAGNPLVGNDPGGDYVVPFQVNASECGVGGNPLVWSDQEPNNETQNPQGLGVFFPARSRERDHDLAKWLVGSQPDLEGHG